MGEAILKIIDNETIVNSEDGLNCLFEDIFEIVDTDLINLRPKCFINNDRLKKISLYKCEIINESAFMNCSNLTDAAFPNARIIYSDAFTNSAITNLQLLGNSKVQLGVSATYIFANTPLLNDNGNIYILESLYDDYMNDPYWNPLIDKIHVWR